MLEENNFYINGEWAASASDNIIDVINPSTEAAFARIRLGTSEDLDRAVAAARAALPSWRATSIDTRRDYLNKLLEIYKSRSASLALTMAKEMGAPLALAQTAQVGAGISHLIQTIKAMDSFEFEKIVPSHDGFSTVFYEPIGVVGLITPWNWPMNQIMLKVAPALASGCTMVLKPSELAPLSATLLAEMTHEAGIPKGVFNLVNGDGPGIGSLMSKHPDIDMISFTGSTRAGREIMKAGADSIKRVCLELGGKGANLVFADADEKAVARGVRHCFQNTGQSCNAPTRMLVEANFYDAAIEQAQAMAAKIQVGPAEIEGRHIGPVVSEAQFNKVQNLIAKGIEEGARLVCGGLGRPDGMEVGYFVKPTIFADVTPDMTIYKEEIFGPVLCMTRFQDEQQALTMANDTPYGLTNYVQTQNVERAKRLARQLNSGMVEVNGEMLVDGTPFSGRGLSGSGAEGGVWGLEEFLVPKAVSGI